MKEEKMGVAEAASVLKDVMNGAHKHESLAEASSYALLKETPEVANFIHHKLIERNKLVRELSALHVASGGILLPGVPNEGGLATFMAIESLAETNPGIHPILIKIAELEKLKYMVGADKQHFN